jgi:cobalt-zinc-cadmium efflux system protein
MAIALAINVAMVAAAAAGGFAFGSLALLADAGHVLSDVGAICVGLIAARMAARPATGRRTFGFLRGEILAAFANGVTLVVIAVLIFVAAIGRLSGPPDVEAAGVVVIGAFGLAGNLAATLVLAAGDRSDLNLEGVLRHSFADALGSLGAIAAGVTILATDWLYADPLAGILIGLLVLASSWRLLREPFDVLMEAAPRGVDVDDVGRAMAGVPGVREVHDLHVWTVTSGFPALAAHVMTDPAAEVDEVRRRVEALLAERYGIEHTTIQAMAEPLLELEDRRPGR